MSLLSSLFGIIALLFIFLGVLSAWGDEPAGAKSFSLGALLFLAFAILLKP